MSKNNGKKWTQADIEYSRLPAKYKMRRNIPTGYCWIPLKDKNISKKEIIKQLCEEGKLISRTDLLKIMSRAQVDQLLYPDVITFNGWARCYYYNVNERNLNDIWNQLLIKNILE